MSENPLNISPIKTESNGNQDPKTGRFVAGNCANPKGAGAHNTFKKFMKDSLWENFGTTDKTNAERLKKKIWELMLINGNVAMIKSFLEFIEGGRTIFDMNEEEKSELREFVLFKLNNNVNSNQNTNSTSGSTECTQQPSAQ